MYEAHGRHYPLFIDIHHLYTATANNIFNLLAPSQAARGPTHLRTHHHPVNNIPVDRSRDRQTVRGITKKAQMREFLNTQISTKLTLYSNPKLTVYSVKKCKDLNTNVVYTLLIILKP